MLFYFVFHFLKNYNDVYVMYCLPVGCNNKKYKLQKISSAVIFHRDSAKVISRYRVCVISTFSGPQFYMIPSNFEKVTL